MASPSKSRIAEALLERHGQTYAAELGIDVARGTPSPLFRLLCANRYDGDLRRLRDEAQRDPDRERTALKRCKGIGEVGVDIFFREAQVVWDELAPFADRRALRSAQRLGLGDDARALARLTDGEPELARLVAGLVRCDLAGDHDDVLAAAGGGS